MKIQDMKTFISWICQLKRLSKRGFANYAAISRRDLGQSPRKCFICDRPAKECARSRRHSVAEMQDYISELYVKNVK